VRRRPDSDTDFDRRISFASARSSDKVTIPISLSCTIIVAVVVVKNAALAVTEPLREPS
jgi:hypothetical protein